METSHSHECSLRVFINIKYVKYVRIKIQHMEDGKVLDLFDAYCRDMSKYQLFDNTNETENHRTFRAGKEDTFSLEPMSMIPFFPTLRPTVGSSICIDADSPCDEESELREIEKEHVAWVRKHRSANLYFLCFAFES